MPKPKRPPWWKPAEFVDGIDDETPADLAGCDALRAELRAEQVRRGINTGDQSTECGFSSKSYYESRLNGRRAIDDDDCTFLKKYITWSRKQKSAAALEAAYEPTRISEEKREEELVRTKPFANLSTEQGVTLCWNGEKRLMSPDDWEKGGGGGGGGAVWREVRRLEREQLRENKEVRASAGREVVQTDRYAPETTSLFNPFRTRSLEGDAHLGGFWWANDPRFSTQIELVDEAWPIVEQEDFGIRIIGACWKPATGAYLREQNISTNMSCVTVPYSITRRPCNRCNSQANLDQRGEIHGHLPLRRRGHCRRDALPHRLPAGRFSCDL